MFQATVSNTLILVWLFVYCFYGHLISSKFAEIGEYAYHSTFYQYPIDLKWFTLFIIARSQRPFFITGCRITKCSLESYSRVSIFLFSCLCFRFFIQFVNFLLFIQIYWKSLESHAIIVYFNLNVVWAHQSWVWILSKSKRLKCHIAKCSYDSRFFPIIDLKLT